MGDLARSVPRAARRKLRFFQQNRFVSPALMSEMIGKTHAHDTAANDDNARVSGKCIRHGGIPVRDAFSLDTISEQKYRRQQ